MLKFQKLNLLRVWFIKIYALVFAARISMLWLLHVYALIYTHNRIWCLCTNTSMRWNSHNCDLMPMHQHIYALTPAHLRRDVYSLTYPCFNFYAPTRTKQNNKLNNLTCFQYFYALFLCLWKLFSFLLPIFTVFMKIMKTFFKYNENYFHIFDFSI